MLGGGFPVDPFLVEIRAMGFAPSRPPRMEASRMEALRGLSTAAGLEAVETREIAVRRTFADFDHFWIAQLMFPSVGPVVAAMTPGEVETLKSRVRAALAADAEGRITYGARAHAVKGRSPK